ncbi:MAG: translation initiation factor [Chitinophagaceae bacterium]|nr:MAG: translation initiation factor [Chitinophagaceae bacterium]
MKKKKRITIYTDEPEYNQENEAQDLSPAEQNLFVCLDKKNRGGKVVTLVQRFVGSDEEIESLCKSLKQFCGVGGSVKDQEIIIQGDQRDKISTFLTKKKYPHKVR